MKFFTPNWTVHIDTLEAKSRMHDGEHCASIDIAARGCMYARVVRRLNTVKHPPQHTRRHAPRNVVIPKSESNKKKYIYIKRNKYNDVMCILILYVVRSNVV